MSDALGFGLTLTAIGLVIVFAVLAAIAGVVALVRGLDSRWQEREAAEEREALTRTPTIDVTTAVLIAAAAATVIAGRHRIRSVKRLLPADAPQSPWSAQGRAVLQGSHVIEKKKVDP